MLLQVWSKACSTFTCPPGNKHIPSQGTFEDNVPFPKVGYLSFLEGTCFSDGLKSPNNYTAMLPFLDQSLGPQETSHDHDLAGPSTWTTFTSFTRFFHEIREVSWRSPELSSILFYSDVGRCLCDFGMAKLDNGISPSPKKKERMSSEKRDHFEKEMSSNHQFSGYLSLQGGRSVKVFQDAKLWVAFVPPEPARKIGHDFCEGIHGLRFQWLAPCLAILWDLRQCDFSKYVGTTRFKFKAPCAKHFNSSTAYLLDILIIFDNILANDITYI